MRTTLETRCEAMFSTVLVLTLSSPSLSFIANAKNLLHNDESRTTFPQSDVRQSINTTSPLQPGRTIIRIEAPKTSGTTFSSISQRGRTTFSATSPVSYSLTVTSQPNNLDRIENSRTTFTPSTLPSSTSANVRNYVSPDQKSSTEPATNVIRDRQFKSTEKLYTYSSKARQSSSATSNPVDDTLRGYTRSAVVTSSTKPLVNATTSTFSTANADEVVFPNRNKGTTRASSPSTTKSVSVNVLWNGLSESTSTSMTPVSAKLPVNSTTQVNEIDFKEVITAPEFKCPDDQKRDEEGKCQVNWGGDKKN